MSNISHIIQSVKTKHPDIYRSVFTKRYSHVEKYGDYKRVLLDYAVLLCLFREKSVPAMNEMEMRCVAYYLAKAHNFPVFFVSAALLEAVRATKADMLIDPVTMHLPFESFYFVLPRNSLTLNKLNYECIEVFRVSKDSKYKLPHDTIIVGGNSSLSIRAKSTSGVDLLRNIIQPFNPIISEERQIKDISSHDERWSLPFTDNDKDSMSVITHIVVNLLFAMQAKPELVESGHKIGYHKKSKSEMWSPNIIGRKYATKTDGTSGTHDSPRLHWRRGHFRQQPYGSRKLENRPTKVIWLEPMIINAEP